MLSLPNLLQRMLSHSKSLGFAGREGVGASRPRVVDIRIPLQHPSTYLQQSSLIPEHAGGGPGDARTGAITGEYGDW